jgi:hypothetical protein
LIDAAVWMILKIILTEELSFAVKVEISLLEVTESKVDVLLDPSIKIFLKSFLVLHTNAGRNLKWARVPNSYVLTLYLIRCYMNFTVKIVVK